MMRLLILLALLFGGCAKKPFTLSIAHINDTHSHLESISYKLLAIGRVEVGGYASIATYVQSLRERKKNLLFLHAGDALQGTLYYTLYKGHADAQVLNLLGIDAQTLGNHEFDDGAENLARFLRVLRYPIVSANVGGAIATDPYIVKHFGNERVAIVGLTVDASKISKPGPTIYFTDYLQRARSVVSQLQNQGIDKIIFLTHLGIKKDRILARRVKGIDLIVGGHSHTLLGDFKALGLGSYGPYPLVIKDFDAPTLIVHAWKWGMVVGGIDVRFDEDGRVKSFEAYPKILIQDEELAKRYAGLAYAKPDQKVSRAIEPYKEGVRKLRKKIIGEAKQDLWHVRLPCQRAPNGDILPSGSLIAPHVARSMLEMTGADIAIQNAGGVRKSILAGPISVADVMELLPFGNTLVLFRMKGSQIQRVLEDALKRSYFKNRGGPFPYVAGVKMAIKSNGVKFEGLDPDRIYKVVTNSFLAHGGAGYKFAGGMDTGYLDSEAMIMYIQRHKSLDRPEPTVWAECIGSGLR